MVGPWWVRTSDGTIQADSRWSNFTHSGPSTRPFSSSRDTARPCGRTACPRPARGSWPWTVVAGRAPTGPIHKTLSFGGYEWIVRNAPSDRGGRNEYDPRNAWTDDNGALHLRIAPVGRRLELRRGEARAGGWARDLTHSSCARCPHLEPAAVFSIFTWDGPAADQNPPRAGHRDQPLGRPGRERTRSTWSSRTTFPPTSRPSRHPPESSPIACAGSRDARPSAPCAEPGAAQWSLPPRHEAHSPAALRVIVEGGCPGCCGRWSGTRSTGSGAKHS